MAAATIGHQGSRIFILDCRYNLIVKIHACLCRQITEAWGMTKVARILGAVSVKMATHAVKVLYEAAHLDLSAGQVGAVASCTRRTGCACRRCNRLTGDIAGSLIIYLPVLRHPVSRMSTAFSVESRLGIFVGTAA